MLLCIGGYSFAGITPPAAVLDAFEKKFPDAFNVKWSMENKTEYEAEFMTDPIAMKTISANFKADGSWIETESQIAQNDVPSVVIAYINQKFPSGKRVYEKIESADKIVFEVEIKGEEYLFDTDGKFIGEAEEE